MFFEKTTFKIHLMTKMNFQLVLSFFLFLFNSSSILSAADYQFQDILMKHFDLQNFNFNYLAFTFPIFIVYTQYLFFFNIYKFCKSRFPSFIFIVFNSRIIPFVFNVFCVQPRFSINYLILPRSFILEKLKINLAVSLFLCKFR